MGTLQPIGKLADKIYCLGKTKKIDEGFIKHKIEANTKHNWKIFKNEDKIEERKE
jgi:hypothetical protein